MFPSSKTATSPTWRRSCAFRRNAWNSSHTPPMKWSPKKWSPKTNPCASESSTPSAPLDPASLDQFRSYPNSFQFQGVLLMLARLLAALQRVLLVGPPGIGKTARILAVAGTSGRQVVTMRASLSERVDFGGALVPDQKKGVTRALPLEQLHQLQTTELPTLLFLDDLGQAP